MQPVCPRTALSEGSQGAVGESRRNADGVGALFPERIASQSQQPWEDRLACHVLRDACREERIDMSMAMRKCT